MPHNDGMQLTSGGLVRAPRASLMRRLQLIPVFCGPVMSDLAGLLRYRDCA
jgi:hypothetical protein